MALKTNTIVKKESGAALVVALIMLVVITLIALASSYTSIFEIKISGNKRCATDAFYAADAGINTITSYSTNFDLTKYTTVIPSTTSQYTNPFSDSTIPNPTSAVGNIVAFLNQSGPPRGGGFSAVNLGYAYYQVQSTGQGTAGCGATTELMEDVMRLLPVQ